MSTVSQLTFQKVNSTLREPLQNLRASRRVNEGEKFAAFLAAEQVADAGRPLHEVREVANQYSLDAIDGVAQRRAAAVTTWFTQAGDLYTELTDIKTTFLTDRGSFDAAVSTLGPDELRGLAGIFQTLSTNLLSANLALDIDTSAAETGRALNRFSPTFDDISITLAELAASKDG